MPILRRVALVSTRFARPSETHLEALKRALGAGHEIVGELLYRTAAYDLERGPSRMRVRLSGNASGVRWAFEQAEDITKEHGDAIRWFVIVGETEIPL